MDSSFRKIKKAITVTLFFALILNEDATAQENFYGIIKSSITNKPISNTEVYEKEIGEVARTNNDGLFHFTTYKNQVNLIFFSQNYNIHEEKFSIKDDTIVIKITPLSKHITEVEVRGIKQKIFELSRLKDIEGTSIHAGKKNEVVLVKQSMANLASNNARQIYSQVSGLNIYQNDDAGLQLNIGGRGLDPNRTSNFNTRQNGYDISADVLGYPESYYTPAAEGLEKIQIIRGAASLQYGTQFGGLVNFKFAKSLHVYKVPVKKVVNWFENQSLDKGWNYGFRFYHKKRYFLVYFFY